MSASIHPVASTDRLPTPKQSPIPRRRDWYPYYAGFSDRFVQAVLTEHLNGREFVLDPWSGTGTTTAVCFKRGLVSKGVDINPALTIIARARLTPLSFQSAALTKLNRLMEVAKDIHSEPNSTDLLERWMRPSAVSRIRAIQQAIHISFANCPSVPPSLIIDNVADRIPIVCCFFYCALFAVTRQLLVRFRATNPMWIKAPRSHAHRLSPSWERLSQIYREKVQELSTKLSLEAAHTFPHSAPFETGSATNLSFDDDAFDSVLTSPPYATRIDYVNGTLPELATLGVDETFLLRLRGKTTGTPVVRGATVPCIPSLLSPTAHDILRSIGSHSSKGSKAYYLPWLRNYLYNIQAGIEEINRTVSANGSVCIVVQDSFYKEIHIDMQRILVEMLYHRGRHLIQRHDFPAPHPRSYSSAQANFPTYPYSRFNRETLLVFG